jgi:hypothetical protein
MQWVGGVLVLATVAVLLRRALRMGGRRAKVRARAQESLRADLQAIYAPVEQEVFARITILGITLNDAFGERQANRHEMAWHIVRLAMGEWERLTELIVGLQDLITKFLPGSIGVVPARRIAVNHFKSLTMKDYVGLYEFLDQILFRSKLRFALQLRLLSHGSAALGKEFSRACRDGSLSYDSSDELWCRLDYYFHDFDLVCKETLLAFRTLLVCQSSQGAQVLALDLIDLLDRGMRVSVSPARQ